MAYNHSQLARECGAVKTPSARLLLMVLASAMDKDKHTCNWRVSTLLHYTKLSMPTYKRAMNEIELAGIITRDKRLGKSSTFIWHPDVAESLRDPVKKDWAEPSAEDKENMERMDNENDEAKKFSDAFSDDDIEEFPCSQCKVEPVSIAGARCSTCIAAGRAEDERIMKERAAKAKSVPPPKPKPAPEPDDDPDLIALGHKFFKGESKCEVCNRYRRSLLDKEMTCDAAQERNRQLREELAQEKAQKASMS